jgi:hypothetical protein
MYIGTIVAITNVSLTLPQNTKIAERLALIYQRPLVTFFCSDILIFFFILGTMQANPVLKKNHPV